MARYSSELKDSLADLCIGLFLRPRIKSTWSGQPLQVNTVYQDICFPTYGYLTASLVSGPLHSTSAFLAKVSTSSGDENSRGQHIICVYLPDVYDKAKVAEVFIFYSCYPQGYVWYFSRSWRSSSVNTVLLWVVLKQICTPPLVHIIRLFTSLHSDAGMQELTANIQVAFLQRSV